MTNKEMTVYTFLVAAVVAWVLLGPGGWVAGIIGALIGLAVAAWMVTARRRRDGRSGRTMHDPS